MTDFAKFCDNLCFTRYLDSRSDKVDPKRRVFENNAAIRV